ncbi:MAG: ABC transporter permease [Dermatophilaceae bacterium]
MRDRTEKSRWRVTALDGEQLAAALAALGWLATGGLPEEARAGYFYGITVAVVLALTLLVAPSLSASSISGDREHGVLASLQTTLLTPADIALGKLLAAWLASLTFLALAVPVLVWALFTGGVSAASFAMALVTIALVLLAVSAIGLAISSLAARTISSVVLTYVVVGVLVLGMPLLFGLTFPMVSSEEMVRVRTFAFTSTPSVPVPSESASPPVRAAPLPDTPSPSATPAPDGSPPDQAWTPREPGPPACREIVALRSVVHTERTWWLLAPNPFVVVADAAPEHIAPSERVYDRGRAALVG